MQMKQFIFGLLACLLSLSSCNQIEKPLPIMGKIDKSFSFYNQDSSLVTEKNLEGKVYVTDFFFTTCPTICPKMKAQMIRINDHFKDRDDFVLFSHSIDSKDTVEVLRDYASRLEVSSKDWQFVTGERNQIFDMAKAYMVTAGLDDKSPGGYIHSGRFVLIDKKRQVRGFYDGTKAEETDELIKDLKRIFNEQPDGK